MTPEEWTLLIVVAVDRGGEEGTVTAEFLDSQNGETTQFKCRSAEQILELGDFVSVKGDEISLVHKPTLIPIRFIVGALIVIPQKTSEPPPPPPRPAVPPKARPVSTFSRRKKAADYSRKPMTESEMVHFNSDAVDLGELFAKLGPFVKAYARDQTRKPVYVSLRLNAEGHTTGGRRRVDAAACPLPARADVQRSHAGQETRSPHRTAGRTHNSEGGPDRCSQGFDGRQGGTREIAFLARAGDREALRSSGRASRKLSSLPLTCRPLGLVGGALASLLPSCLPEIAISISR
jgi:hypothetical protein